MPCVCADRAVLKGYNDLAITDTELLNEWDYEKNGELLPTNISRNSMRIVWWKCVSGHSWRAKITDRTIEGKGCRICEKEFQTAFPRLLIMLYAARNGLKVETDIDNIIGIELDTYIPELKLAIELEGVTKTEHEFQTVKEHICKCNDIKYVRIKQISDFFKMAQSIREAFGKCHTYFSADDKNDIELLKKRFAEWQKRKVV